MRGSARRCLLGIGGAVQARTELFNHLLGRKVLDPESRPVGSAALRIRRGKVHAVRGEARRRHDRVARPATRATTTTCCACARFAARAEVAERQLALERVEKSLPRMARARPRGLMILLWPLWWLLTRRHRRMLADRRFTEIAYDHRVMR